MPRRTRSEALSGVDAKNRATAKNRIETHRGEVKRELSLVTPPPQERPEQQKREKPPTYLFDTGLLFESPESKEIRRRARARAAYLREKYKTQKPPTRLETMGEVFMSPEQQKALNEARIRYQEKNPHPRLPKLHKQIPWGRIFAIPSTIGAVLGWLGSVVNTAIESPDMQRYIGTPKIRAASEQVLTAREKAKQAEQALMDRIAGIEDITEQMERRNASIRTRLNADAYVSEILNRYTTEKDIKKRMQLQQSVNRMGYQIVVFYKTTGEIEYGLEQIEYSVPVEKQDEIER